MHLRGRVAFYVWKEFDKIFIFKSGNTSVLYNLLTILQVSFLEISILMVEGLISIWIDGFRRYVYILTFYEQHIYWWYLRVFIDVIKTYDWK